MRQLAARQTALINRREQIEGLAPHRSNGAPISINASPGSLASEFSLLQVAWHRRWTVILIALAAVLAGILYLLIATPLYTVTSRLYVEQSPRVFEAGDDLPFYEGPFLYAQCQILTSTPILELALSEPGVQEMKMLADVENRVEYLKDQIVTSVGKRDALVSVSLESAFPEEGSRLLSGVVSSYLTYQSIQKRSTAANVLKILRKERDNQLAELREKRREAHEFSRQHGTFAPDADAADLATRKLMAITEDLMDAQLALLKGKTAYDEAARLVPAEALAAQPGAQAIALQEKNEEELQLMLSRWQHQHQMLQQWYMPEHPQVRNAEAQLKQLRIAYVRALQRRVETARQTEAALQESFRLQQKLALEQSGPASEHAQLVSDVRRMERSVDILDGQIKDMIVAEEAGNLNIKVLEPATASTKPTSPRRGRTLAVALLLGLVLGSMVAALQEKLDPRLRSEHEVSATLRLPVLATIPRISRGQSSGSRGQLVLRQARSHAADAYHTVRAALAWGLPTGDAKVLVITSPAPSEGKTTLASNLAISMAMGKERVLLVDADFRHPGQHRIFQIDHKIGLSNVLEGQAPLQQALRPSGVKGLDVLPCGPPPSDSASLFGSQMFTAVVEELSKIYDRIIFDAPPVMSAPDAQILAACCGVTVLVVRADRSSRRLSEQAREALANVGAPVVGVVINGGRRWWRYGYGGQMHPAGEPAFAGTNAYGDED